MSKVLIIGSNGQLGKDLVSVLKKKHKIVALTHKDIEISNRKIVRKVLKKYSFDFAINTAAFHKVEKCEANPQKTFKVNALGAYYLSKEAAQKNATIIYISTNYVFDGKKKKYFEDDFPNPINVYGASKLAGELLTKIANRKHYIIRTSGLFGHQKSGKGYNFVDLMIEKNSIESPMVVSDEYSSLTNTEDLAEKIKYLIEKKKKFGIYHITNGGGGSWYEFAKFISKTANSKNNPNQMNQKDRISKIFRPKYSILDSHYIHLRPWKEAIKSYIKESYAK